MKFFWRKHGTEGQEAPPVPFSEIADRLRNSPPLLYLLSLGFILLVELPLKATAVFEADPLYFWLGLFVSGAFFFLLTRWTNRGRLPRFVAPAGQRLAPLFVGVASGLLLFVWLFLVDRAWSALLPSLYSGARNSDLRLFTPRIIALAILAGNIMLPLGEELFFRGHLLPELARRRPFPLALLLSAVAYGLRALDPFLFVSHLGRGLLLGWIIHRYHLMAALIAALVTNLLYSLFLQ